MLKAVIFDMDGVLVDSEPVHFKANYLLMKKLGIDIDYEYYKQFIGSTVRKVFEEYIKEYNIVKYSVDDLIKMADEILDALIKDDGYPKIMYVDEFVKGLYRDGYLLAVASSSRMEKILFNIKNLSIEHCFNELVSGMEIKNPKPSPEIFLTAAKKLGVEPSECLVIEDSENGVNAAKNAGMACVGFINKNSGEQCLKRADYLIESFEELDESFLRMVHSHAFHYPYIAMETKRIIIREIKLEDIEKLYEIYKEPDITKYMEGLYETMEEEIEYTKHYIQKIYPFYGYGTWILESFDGEIIGRAGIEYKDDEYKNGNYLGYVIRKDYQNLGYAYEATKEIIKYAFEKLYIEELYTKIHRENLPSIKLSKKLGFEVLEEKDNYIYMIIKDTEQ